MSLFEQASLVVTPNGYKAGKLYSIKPTSGAGDLDVVRATGATRVNASGLIETVANNVPRLDYPPLGGCPSILIEPQRTNLLTYSEDFSDSSWTKLNTTFSGDTLTGSAGTSLKAIFKSETTNGVQSAYFDVEYVNHKWIQILVGSNSGDNGFVNYDIENKIIGAQSGGYTGSIKDFGSFLRVYFNLTTTGKTSLILALVDSGSSGRAAATSSTGSLNLFRSQLEAASNATSYIPTVASTVTRNADVATVDPPTGTTEIIETINGVDNTITTIPTTYQLPNGRIDKVIMK
jgi:hypothetical protein